MKNIVMPAAGQTTNIATVTKICASVGDKVKRGQVLLEVETDKANLPIESYAVGYVLSIKVKEYDTVDAGDLLMVIGSEEELKVGTAEQSEPAAETPAPAVTVAEEDDDEDDFVPIVRTEAAPKTEASAPKADPLPAAYPAMPNVKKLARERGLSLAGLTPKNGLFLKRTDLPSEAPAQLSAAMSAAASLLEETAPAYEVLPIAGLRSKLAKNLEASAAIPTFTMSVAVSLSGVGALLKAAAESGVTLSSLVLKAIASASERYPLLRTRYTGGELRAYAGDDLALLLSAEHGAVRVTVPEVLQSRLSALSAEAEARFARVNAGDLAVTGDAATVVCDGSALGVSGYLPTLQAPSLTAIGVGAPEEKLTLTEEGKVKAEETVNLSAVFDARFWEAPVAASALQYIKTLLETPALMLV